MNGFGLSLSELMRPRQPEDLALPRKHIQGIRNVLLTGTVNNMLFSGPPGHGKTSVVHMITDALGADVFTVAGSTTKGDIREMVVFASICCFLGPKICVIEEAEFISPTIQASLRSVIEEMTHVRFLVTTNNVNKVDAAVRSRLYHIDFAVPEDEEPRIIRRLVARYTLLLAAMGRPTARDKIQAIVESFFPDFRAIANAVEFELLQSPARYVIPLGKRISE